MGRFRPVIPGETWTDPKTGQVWEVLDRSHARWYERRDRPLKDDLPPISDRSDRPRGYEVKAEDVVLAGGAAFAAMFHSEAALWVEAGRLARQFMRDVDRGETAVNKLREWMRQDTTPVSVVSPVTSQDPRIARRFDNNPVDDFVGQDGMAVYPGKFPPGYRPGRGVPVRARAGKIRIMSSRFERA